MLVGEFAQKLGVELLIPELGDCPIAAEGCYIGDLLSNVISRAGQGQLWMTVMTNTNIVAVAHLAGLSGVLLVDGAAPMPGVLDKAREEGIPVFSTAQPAYPMALCFWQMTEGLAAEGGGRNRVEISSRY